MAFYKVREAAEKTGVHQSTIHSYIKRGKIPHKIIDGAKQVQLIDVQKVKPLIFPKGKHTRPNYGSHMVERDGKRLATVKKAARLLNIDRSTIYKYIRQGKVEEIHLPDYMFKFVDVDELKAVIEGTDEFKQKVIVFEKPKDDQRHSRHGATTTTQRVEDLELLYYDLLEKYEGLSTTYTHLGGIVKEHKARISALENQQPAQPEPAINWSAVERGTRVEDTIAERGGIFLALQSDDWALVLLDNELNSSIVNTNELKLEETD